MELGQSLYRRFGMVEGAHELALATVCDPRYKKQGFRDNEKASDAFYANRSHPLLNTQQPLRKVQLTRVFLCGASWRKK